MVSCPFKTFNIQAHHGVKFAFHVHKTEAY